mmetsp:Transcript_15647/g.29668  ORF Transcript_15647/g.29668 Transcript_15647/m.29668 type:complete len:88 (+) Transcript_15647:3-266(+)
MIHDTLYGTVAIHLSPKNKESLPPPRVLQAELHITISARNNIQVQVRCRPQHHHRHQNLGLLFHLAPSATPKLPSTAAHVVTFAHVP